MSALILVVDDEPDVADLFRQQFRRDVRANHFALDFALSGEEALGKVARRTGPTSSSSSPTSTCRA